MCNYIVLKIFPIIASINLNRSLVILYSISTTWLFSSCTKLVDVQGPPTSINEDVVYASDGTAIAAMTGIYGGMSMTSFGETSGDLTGLTSVSLLSGLSADELTLYNEVTAQRYIAYYKNSLVSNPSQSFGSEHWPTLFNYIFRCNEIIQGVMNSNSIKVHIKKQLLGEARFTRAFCYFYLVNLYGELPLVKTTDVAENLELSKSSIQTIYDFIKQDLIAADSLLNTLYLNGKLETADERLRPTKWAALSLLSRVYLYTKDYVNAENAASAVISNSSLFSLPSLNDAFLANSSESIWQLQPVRMGFNTEDGAVFILPATGPQDVSGGAGYPVFLSDHLITSFEQNDARRTNWVDSILVGGITYFFPYKYKNGSFGEPVTENLMVLRLSEQHLIRAEARAEQNNIDGALQDLNIIRNRAELPEFATNDKQVLLSSILHEKQIELFTEWGHRWLDLKRTGKINTVMTTVAISKGSQWQNYQALYPIPFEDIQRSSKLTQNSGY